jgi:hemoglobin
MYEFAGGEAAFLALAAAHHERCLKDPVLNHPFSHSHLNPRHVPRLAAYWAEVFGGPPSYSRDAGDHSAVLDLHARMDAESDLGERFLACFARALDDAALPADPRFRAAMLAYMEWAVAEVMSYSPPDSEVAAGQRVPRWSWDGPQPAATS